MKYIYTLLCVAAFSASTVAQKSHADKAKELAQKFIIADGHVDLPYRLQIKNFRLEKSYTGIPVQSEEGDFDFVRAKAGGLDAPFMSIYIPANRSTQEAKLLADTLINMVEFIAKEKSNYFEVAKTPDDVKRIKKAGKIALPMGMENGSPITSVSDVALYRKKGISYVTLTHSKDNDICDSSYDSTKTWSGLSPFGVEVVKEMNKTGIMVDVSHISDDAFFDVIKVSKVPVIASHSSARKFTPCWQRNMSDEMLKALKANGGVIMVNFGSTFLDSDVVKYKAAATEKIRKELEEKGLAGKELRDGIAREIAKDYRNYSDVKRVADHIDHIVKIAGIDHVGIGSDYDGVGDSLPTGLKDVSDYPNLLAELLQRGYSEKDIEKICSGNLFRVWNKVLEYAKSR
ncbi:Membrane dipeptidase [Leadbetterella byssophila DSM 17132]|uniref:Membrane dipeptidase n=1 Tax=Leadbetterella byssophila (strain DSM 17132 / JCM 16389 / KACC 11308 / NBRC 106382 / 4M15) TaxID=649349 RepID=E4RQY4_LEAB4|nr:dipeptidase [Leadbetterella byssophila]ADQ18427.1 Membrane dipeptidase [Leadbetterella byssophila DSM 17132]